MQFYDWLKIQANPNLSADEMAHLLTMSGLEVEEVENRRAGFQRRGDCRSEIG